jgi:hypothetical protein
MHFVQVKLAGIQCDLEQVYNICRHFSGNFESLSSGCFRCSISGSELALPNKYPPLSAIELDNVVLHAKDMLCSGQHGAIGHSRQLMKQVSMHPVEVYVMFFFAFRLTPISHLQSGFRALSYVDDNHLPLHDVDHITMGFFEMVIDFIEKNDPSQEWNKS